MAASTCRLLAPPPKLTLSQWADSNRYLSLESSAEPGQWKTSRAEYMHGVMDAMTDPKIEQVVVVKGAQTGYTEALLNVVGYHIDLDPCPILVIQPTIEMGETWSKDRLAPMLRDTPVLTARVHDPKSRDSDNTIRAKNFPGGRLTIVGANAPSGLASRPIRLVVGDEVDRYSASAGTEGDPLTLASARQITFWNRKTILGSTPGRLETSIIWRHWMRSDQRRFYVPCPHCEHPQTLRWDQVRWDEDKPQTALYQCEACGALWNDVERWRSIAKGAWKPDKPEITSVAGFHIPGFLSTWLTLRQIVEKYLASKDDPNEYQGFVNTVLGMPYEGNLEGVEGTALIGRAENYGPESLPDGIRAVVAGVDTQVNRLEVQILGFGAHEECWAISYEIIRGDPAKKEIWDELDGILLQKFHSQNGREFRVAAACIDSGGHAAAQVLQFCRARFARRIFATKGAAGARPIWPRRSSKTKKNRGDVFIVGVDTAKDAIYGRLAKIAKPGPGYIHFPVGEPFDQIYFDQLTSEKVETKVNKRDGRPVRVWVLPPKRRNEALDTFVYAMAARHAINLRLDKLPPPPSPAPSAPPENENAIAAAPPPPPPPVAMPRSPWERPQQSWLGQRGQGWWSNRR